MQISLSIPGESDFESVAMKVTFGPGEPMATVNITILNGGKILEPPKQFSILLKSNESDVLLGNRLANITILNENSESC